MFDEKEKKNAYTPQNITKYLQTQINDFEKAFKKETDIGAKSR